MKELCRRIIMSASILMSILHVQVISHSGNEFHKENHKILPDCHKINQKLWCIFYLEEDKHIIHYPFQRSKQSKKKY